eukprot:g268.t1
MTGPEAAKSDDAAVPAPAAGGSTGPISDAAGVVKVAGAFASISLCDSTADGVSGTESNGRLAGAAGKTQAPRSDAAAALPVPTTIVDALEKQVVCSLAAELAAAFSAGDLEQAKAHCTILAVKLEQLQQAKKCVLLQNIPQTSIKDAPVTAAEALAKKLDELPQLVQSVQSDDESLQLEGAIGLRKLLSIEHNPHIQQHIQQVIDAGVVPAFVEFMRSDNTKLQYEAAWALTNIASGTSHHTRVVIDHGAIPIFVQLLASPNDDVCEQAVWALGNIAGDSPACRNLVLEHNALAPLLDQLRVDTSKLSMLRTATWTLMNVCRGKPPPLFDAVRPALGTLAQLIFSRDDEVLTDACWALSYLSDGPNDKIQAVIEAGVSRRLVELLVHPSPSVQTPALHNIGNIVTGDDIQTQVILDCSALPNLLSLLSSLDKGIRKGACWTISNITAGNKDQIQMVIDANIIIPLIQLLTTAEFDIRKEAAWAISNATSGSTPAQIKYLVQQGCICPLCDLLTSQDAKIVMLALEGLKNILKAGYMEMKQTNSQANAHANFIDEAKGLDKIQNLQKHENADISDKAAMILETYYGAEETECP